MYNNFSIVYLWFLYIFQSVIGRRNWIICKSARNLHNMETASPPLPQHQQSLNANIIIAFIDECVRSHPLFILILLAVILYRYRTFFFKVAIVVFVLKTMLQVASTKMKQNPQDALQLQAFVAIGTLALLYCLFR